MDDVSRELRAFLDYVAGEKPDDAFVEKLEKAVKKAKRNRQWRHEYMTLLMRDQENMERGKKVGEEMMLMLIQKLVDDNRFDDISKIRDDQEYRQSLYKEYGIFI